MPSFLIQTRPDEWCNCGTWKPGISTHVPSCAVFADQPKSFCFVLKGYVCDAKAHIADERGLPLCGTRVDTTALECEEDPGARDICKRCLAHARRWGV
jgi:hypothetical protein